MNLIHPEDIPAEILEAARKLERYAIERGCAGDWKILQVCSRNYAYKYEILRDALKMCQTQTNSALRHIGAE